MALLDSREDRRRRAKNLALLIVLGGFAILFYVITIVRMGGRPG